MRLVGYVPASLSGLDTGSGAQEQQLEAVYFDTTETARAERAERPARGVEATVQTAEHQMAHPTLTNNRCSLVTIRARGH